MDEKPSLEYELSTSSIGLKRESKSSVHIQLEIKLNAIKQGYLTKQGGSRKNWRRRWFSLQQGGELLRLSYYKTFQECSKGEDPINSIYLDSSKLHRTHSDRFEIDCFDRTFFFRCDSEEDCTEWVNAILSEMSKIEGHSAPMMPSKIEYEGYLVKRGGTIKTKKRRWFVLRGLRLIYYKNESKTSPLGLIDLGTCSQVLRSQNDGKSFDFEVLTISRHYLLTADNQEDTDKWVALISGKIGPNPQKISFTVDRTMDSSDSSDGEYEYTPQGLALSIHNLDTIQQQLEELASLASEFDLNNGTDQPKLAQQFPPQPQYQPQQSQYQPQPSSPITINKQQPPQPQQQPGSPLPQSPTSNLPPAPRARLASNLSNMNIPLPPPPITLPISTTTGVSSSPPAPASIPPPINLIIEEQDQALQALRESLRKIESEKNKEMAPQKDISGPHHDSNPDPSPPNLNYSLPSSSSSSASLINSIPYPNASLSNSLPTSSSNNSLSGSGSNSNLNATLNSKLPIFSDDHLQALARRSTSPQTSPQSTQILGANKPPEPRRKSFTPVEAIYPPGPPTISLKDKELSQLVQLLYPGNDPANQIGACNEIIDRIQLVPTIRSQIRPLRGLQVLLTLVQSFDLAIRFFSLRCLSSLITEDENREDICKANGITILGQLLADPNEDPRICKQAFRALVNISFTQNPQIHQEIRVRKCLYYVCQNLAQGNEEIKGLCLQILMNSTANESNTIELLQYGIIKLLLNVIQTGVGNLQRFACFSLANLSCFDAVKIECEKLSVLPPLLELLVSPSIELQSEVFRALMNLSTSDNCKLQMKRFGAIPPLIAIFSRTLLDKNPANERILIRCVGILNNLAIIPECQIEIASKDGLKYYTSGLISKNIRVQFHSALGVATLSANEKCRERFDPNISAALVELMKVDSAELRAYAVKAVSNFTLDEPYRIEFGKLGACALLIAMLESKNEEFRLYDFALVALLNLSLDGYCRDAIRVDGGLLTVFNIVQDPNQKERNLIHALKLLTNLAYRDLNRSALVAMRVVPIVLQLRNSPVSAISRQAAKAAQMLGLTV